MLHLRVHGQGEVIRVLLVSLELGRPNLPSFLQGPREREGEALHVETEVEEGTPIRVKQKRGALIRVKPPPCVSWIEASVGGPTRGPGNLGGAGMSGAGGYSRKLRRILGFPISFPPLTRVSLLG